MSDKGIPFSHSMVGALLAGRKTQTRRLLADAPRGEWHCDKVGDKLMWVAPAGSPKLPCIRPYAVGDRLYVREAYYQFGHWEPVEGASTKGGRQKWAFVADRPDIVFEAPGEHRLGRHHKDSATPAWHKRLGRFMPRAASRLWLAVIDVRVQRLQECSEADASAEGLAAGDDVDGMDPRGWYRDLWDSLHTAEGTTWDANPWVVAVTFEVHRGNIDVEVQGA